MRRADTAQVGRRERAEISRTKPSIAARRVLDTESASCTQTALILELRHPGTTPTAGTARLRTPNTPRCTQPSPWESHKKRGGRQRPVAGRASIASPRLTRERVRVDGLQGLQLVALLLAIVRHRRQRPWAAHTACAPPAGIGWQRLAPAARLARQ